MSEPAFPRSFENAWKVFPELVTTLEHRRHRALVAVTTDADPVVLKAATILSNVAMPMTAIELQEAGWSYIRS